MHVLVAVASKHGSTREIAAAIADELQNANLHVDFKDIADVAEVVAYNAVIFGSSIYAGHWLPEAHTFAEHFRADLARVPLWIFSSGPIGAPDPQPHNDPQKLAAAFGNVPIREHRVFVGKLDRQNLGFAERAIARLVKAPEGDFRDWDAIRAWSREIAARITTSIPA